MGGNVVEEAVADDEEAVHAGNTVEVLGHEDRAAAAELMALRLETLPEEHEDVGRASRAQKRGARRKRVNSARALRRSLRLMEKEEAGFELPEDKAARVQ